MILVICAMAMAAPAAAQLADTPWSMFHHDLNHTGLSPYYGPDTSAVKWTFSTGDKIHGSAAIAEDGTIYIGTRDYCPLTRSRLYAINPDGTEKWHWSPPRYQGNWLVDYIDSTPGIASDGTIYTGCWNRRLYALYPNGTLKWEFYDSNWKKSRAFVLTSPAIAPDGVIYIGNNNGKLYAINSDGSLKWSYQTGKAIQSSPAVGSDGTVYVGSYDRNLYAINPDGSLKWKYLTGMIRASPAIGSDGTVYVGSYDKNLYAINPDGSLKWKYQTGCWVVSSPAIGSDGTIYVGSHDNKLYAINPGGSLKWSYNTGCCITSSPAIDAYGTIYTGSADKHIHAINPDGSLLWNYNTGNGIYHSSPAIASDGTVYIGNLGGKLYAFGPGTPPNRPPVLDLIGQRTAYEAAELNITITASDPDCDSLTFSSNATFGTLTPINSTATYWSWTPDYDDAGIYYVDFGVSEGEFSDNETVTITVEDVNRPPELEEIGNQMVEENETLAVDVNATDPDGDALIYSCNRTDLFTNFNPTTGAGSWITGYADAGIYYVNFGVSDGKGGIANETVTITVEDVNRLPELEEVGDQTVNESETLTIDVNATDPDSDLLTYSCNRTDLFTDFNALTGIGSWTPCYEDSGIYYVDFGVSDGKGGIDNETVSLTVENVNRPPELERIGDRSVNESELLEFIVNATDPDGDGLTYSASNLPDGASFDPATQIFSWNPSLEQDGLYRDVHFGVSDGDLIDWENITIRVGDMGDPNSPPIFEPIGDKSVNENELLEFIVNATDPDGDNLAYSASNLPDGATFNNTTRTFSWTPTFEQAGTYPGVYFEVSDGELTNWTSITIIVNDTNRPPGLEGMMDQSVNETETLTVDVNATDPDGDVLIYSCNRTDLFTDFNLLTGTGSWTMDYYDAGIYCVNFGISDGKGGIDNETVAITVEDVNRPPELEEIGNQTVEENETLTVDANATDPDGDALIYSCNRTDLFTNFNPTTGIGSWTTDYYDGGIYCVGFGVSDGKGGIDNETVTITVEEVNRQPELDGIGAKSVNESGLLEFTVNATDLDEDELTYSVSNLPSGATFNSTTREFAWIPAFGQAGVYHDVSFEVTDGELTDSENITITVTGVSVEISVLPADMTVSPQDQFDVRIHIDPNGLPVYAVQYYLAYNTSVVRAETQLKGLFLGGTHDTIIVVNDIDQPSGEIAYAETRKIPNGVDAKENITRIHFIAIGPRSATTSMTLYDLIISDIDGNRMSYTVRNGTVELTENIPPVPIGISKHRINNVAQKYQSTAVLCSCSYDPDYGGEGGNITYIRWAFGDGQYGTTEGLPVDNCTCKEHKYESWQWDPLGVPPDPDNPENGGNYVPFEVQLEVTDDGCPELTNTTNFTIDVYIAGDANGDGEVNILDAVWVGKHWRATCGTTGPCENCEGYLWDGEQKDGTDLNNDCEINILDAVIIGANWRHTAW